MITDCRKMRSILLYIFIVLGSILSLAQVTAPRQEPATGNAFGLFVHTPKHEVRAVWLTTISGLDWPKTLAKGEASVKKQKEELTQTLDHLREAGINTVLFQTRVRATTVYPSAYEPWDASLTGTVGRSPGYDPLAFAIEECHRRGMELHAWVVTIPIGKWTAAGCQRLRKKYPKLVRKIGDEGYLNPEQSQTAHYLADICEEITRNYDVDGIHLDYIRYPETWKIKVSRPQGRQFITTIAETISRRVKALKPWVKMSCAPIGKHDDLSRYRSGGWNAHTTVCQDAQEWLRTGIMDQLYPMMYFQGNNFYPFAIDWAEHSYGRTVVSGLGIYFLSPKEKNWSLDVVTREMFLTRQLGIGHAYFRSQFLTDNTKGIYSFVSKRFDTTPALVPPMTWMNAEAPAAPATVHLDTASNMLSWDAVTAKESYILYNVYASHEWPVDTENAENLMAVRTRETSLKVPTGCYYAVAACNRYGMESTATQSHHFDKPQRKNLQALTPDGFLRCDGRQLSLPPFDDRLGIDIDMLTVVTLEGCIVKTIPRTGNTVDVSTLREGVYQLRSLDRRGATHLLGYFTLRR